MLLIINSWNDGGVEYLNHLERQVAQKQRVRQVSLLVLVLFLEHL